MNHRIRFWCLLFAVIALIAFATQNLAVATGQRYHDEIFASSTVTSDIAYGRSLDENSQPVTLLLDLYQPTGDTETSRPVYIWVHGGAFISGDKADAENQLIADRFAKRGYVTASINYRLRAPNPNLTWGTPQFAAAIADAQHDAQAAVRWFRANAATYHIDPNLIAIGGYSAGAITSLYVAYNSGDPGDSGNPGYPSTVWPIVDVCGGLEDTGLMDAGEPPVLIVHGTADVIVPYQYTTNIVARAQTVGIPVELHTLNGASHFVWYEGYTEQIVGWMSNFLYQYLAPAATPTPRPVSGLAEPPDPAGSPDDGTSPFLIVIAVAGAGVALTAGGWYARRRYSVRRR